MVKENKDGLLFAGNAPAWYLGKCLSFRDRKMFPTGQKELGPEKKSSPDTRKYSLEELKKLILTDVDPLL